jgi:hypothetical protein
MSERVFSGTLDLTGLQTLVEPAGRRRALPSWSGLTP